MASFEETESTKAANDKSFLILNYLDSIEDNIDNIYRKVQDLSQERDTLLTLLSQLEAESKEIKPKASNEESCYSEIQSHIDRLRQRCLSIEIKTHVMRTEQQEHSYTKVNSLVKELEHLCFQEDVNTGSFKDQAKSYLNACVSDIGSSGPVDYRFQGMILDCKLEDQKQFRQRLECLVEGKIHEEFLSNVIQDKVSAINNIDNGINHSQSFQSTSDTQQA